MNKVGIVYDSSQTSKGHHGTHFAFTGLPGVEIVLADPNIEGMAARMQAMLPPSAAPLDYEHIGPRPARYFAENNRFAAWDLLQAVEEDRQPLASVHDAVHVLEMIYGIYAASLSRRGIPFPLGDRNHPLG